MALRLKNVIINSKQMLKGIGHPIIDQPTLPYIHLFTNILFSQKIAIKIIINYFYMYLRAFDEMTAPKH